MSTSIQEQDLIQEIKDLKQRISDLERQQRTIAKSTGVSIVGDAISVGGGFGPSASGIEIRDDLIRLYTNNPSGDITGQMDILWDSWSLQINFPSVALYRGFTDPIVVKTAVPATPTSVGAPGEIASDNTHLYICTNFNTWRRVALSTW